MATSPPPLHRLLLAFPAFPVMLSPPLRVLKNVSGEANFHRHLVNHCKFQIRHTWFLQLIRVDLDSPPPSSLRNLRLRTEGVDLQ